VNWVRVRRLRYGSLSAISVLAAFFVSEFWAGPAAAYRPFDGTDAAVADPNEIEIEFQPIGALWQGSDKSLVGPWTVLNFGFENRWEAVLEGKGIIPVSPGQGRARHGHRRPATGDSYAAAG